MYFLSFLSTFHTVYNDIHTIITCGHPNDRITVYVYVCIRDWRVGGIKFPNSTKKPSNLVCENKKTIYAPDFLCSFSIQSVTT